jgi:hypothetical protein
MAPPATVYHPSPRQYRAPWSRSSTRATSTCGKSAATAASAGRRPGSASATSRRGGRGVEAVADGLWDVYYRTVTFGRFSERTGRLEDDRGRLAVKDPSDRSAP